MTCIVLLALALAQADDEPDKAVKALQKALREKKWEVAYDLQAPSDREQQERDFRDSKLPDLEGAAEFLGLAVDEVRRLQPRDFFIRLMRRADEFDPDTHAGLAGAKFRKERDGEEWYYEHVEESRRDGVPLSTRHAVSAVKENGRWYVSFAGPRRRLNEYAASQQLAVLVCAQADFRAKDRDSDGRPNYWTADVRGLHTLKDIRLIDAALAAADGAPSPQSPALAAPAAPLSGYWFAAVRTHAAGFALVARPARYGVTGRRTFVTDERGVVWRKDTKGAAPDAFPADPARDGWERVP